MKGTRYNFPNCFVLDQGVTYRGDRSREEKGVRKRENYEGRGIGERTSDRGNSRGHLFSRRGKEISLHAAGLSRKRR